MNFGILIFLPQSVYSTTYMHPPLIEEARSRSKKLYIPPSKRGYKSWLPDVMGSTIEYMRIGRLSPRCWFIPTIVDYINEGGRLQLCIIYNGSIRPNAKYEGVELSNWSCSLRRGMLNHSSTSPLMRRHRYYISIIDLAPTRMWDQHIWASSNMHMWYYSTSTPWPSVDEAMATYHYHHV
jgi:hypothetical protein